MHTWQSKHAQVKGLKKGTSIESEAKKCWPNAHLYVMEALVYVITMMNDPRIDWTDATVPPAVHTVVTEAATTSQPRKGSTARFGRSSEKSSKSRRPSTNTITQYDDEVIQARAVANKFKFENFKSDYDSTKYSTTEPFKRDVLILWPHIPECGERTLEDICGGDPDIANRFMALCVMHMDMRVCELLVDAAEEPIRTGVASHAGLASAKDACNDMLRNTLRLRHQIAAREDGTLYPVALDGKDARLLRDDWLKLADDDLERMNTRAEYSSDFFRVLHNLYAGFAERQRKLLLIATAVKHYALAMRELRRSPRDMQRQPGGASGVHARFEAESMRFCAHWVALGEQHKGYGFHLWASAPTLFRKWGCMELISQTAMEGTIGKLGRIMPHIKLHAAGRYDEDTLASGPEARAAVLQARRAGVRTYEQAVYDELSLEAQAAEYELLPCKKRSHKHQYTMKEVHMLMDRAIHEGRVMAYADFVKYARRYIGFMMVWCFLRGRDKVFRSREAHARGETGLTYGQQLLAEYHAYYARWAMRQPGEAIDDVRDAQEQRWRKADWRAKQQAAKQARQAAA